MSDSGGLDFRPFERPCVADNHACFGTGEYLWADRTVYQRLKIERNDEGKLVAEIDDHDLKPPPIEEEEDLVDVRCPECGTTLYEEVELHKLDRWMTHDDRSLS